MEKKQGLFRYFSSVPAGAKAASNPSPPAAVPSTPPQKTTSALKSPPPSTTPALSTPQSVSRTASSTNSSPAHSPSALTEDARKRAEANKKAAMEKLAAKKRVMEEQKQAAFYGASSPAKKSEEPAQRKRLKKAVVSDDESESTPVEPEHSNDSLGTDSDNCAESPGSKRKSAASVTPPDSAKRVKSSPASSDNGELSPPKVASAKSLPDLSSFARSTPKPEAKTTPKSAEKDPKALLSFKFGSGSKKSSIPEADDDAEDENDQDEDDDAPLSRRLDFSDSKSAGSSKSTGSAAKSSKKDSPAAPSPAATEDGHAIEPFLRPENIKDKNGRRPGHPDYNPRTLYVPPEAMKKMTPGQKQYWDIKSENFDVVLFFKMGKFYELFDDDADVGVKHLSLNMMKGNRRHAGFPEAAYSKYAEQLVKLGFKVGRVEQMETPEALAARNQESKSKGGSKVKADKVVKRDMCSMLTKGTLVDPDLIGKDDATYLLSVCENEAANEYGVCFVDTATGSFHVGQFVDDRQRTRLRTLLAQIRPEEVVFPRDNLSKKTRSVFNSELRSDVIQNPIKNGTEFLDAPRTIQELSGTKYFSKPAANDDDEDGKETLWPPALEEAKDLPLLMSAVGGCIWYLKRLLLDEELVSLRRFYRYDPSSHKQAEFLVLDGQTLQNLEILENQEGTAKGSLLSFVDHTCTPFGKRTIRQWLARPLGRIPAIEDRLNAVEDLMSDTDLSGKMGKAMQSLPDLERLLSRIHANALGKDRNAVMYTNISKKKLEDFLKVLDGFEKAQQVIALFDHSEKAFRSKRLAHITTIGAGYPDLRERLKFFNNAFDKKVAKEAGRIIPFAGVDDEYDTAQGTITRIKRELDECLEEVKKRFNDKKICFVDKNNEKFQLEISVSTLEKVRAPNSYLLLSQTKTVKRFWTDEIKALATELDQAEEKRDEVLKDIMRRIFAQFVETYALWVKAVNCLAELDCLRSLAHVSALCMPGESCRPEFIEGGGDSVLDIRNGVHPSLAGGEKTFIPNDIVMGCKDNPSRFLLVSGPNMGGKSTLLRQTCVFVILAQLGCYVPAEKCRLTPVDRIFTRVGANDRIMQGQSTFLVELEETANILRHASSRSLVILDELGRGTSTFDGTAIAYSVIQYLAQKVNCCTLFSTHYHMLMEEFAADPRIAMYHMACVVDPKEENVTFLYKFVRGSCPKSYGMNVARLAGLPESVVKRANEMSHLFEERLEIAHGSRSKAASERGVNESRDMTVELQLQLVDSIAKAVAARDLIRLKELAAEVASHIRHGELA